MLVVIDDILYQRNKTRYWLAKETGITYANIKLLCDGQTSSIRFSAIDLICQALDCTPNDIFYPERKRDL